MNRDEIIQQLNEEIERLQSAVRALKGSESGNSQPASAAGATAKRRGRRGPRHMSAEARARIAAAQRKRWAKVKAGK